MIKIKKMNYKKKIFTSWPYLGKSEADSVKEVLTDGWLGSGEYVTRFENNIKKKLSLKNKYVTSIKTGSDAIKIALCLANVKPGDEVILPSLNFLGAAQAVMILGAIPVFCDVDLETLTVNEKLIAKMISKKTKAIISVDYSCAISPVKKIKNICGKKIRVIHDAAHSFYSKEDKKYIGNNSDICMFSFDPLKSLTCIDGGALILNTRKEYIQSRKLRQLGFEVNANVSFFKKKKVDYDVDSIGFRDHMTNVNAAIGISQLKKIDEIKRRKYEIVNIYEKNLTNLKNITIPRFDKKNIVSFLYPVRVNSKIRDDLRYYLKKNNIFTGLHWYPLHKMSLFKKFRSDNLKNTNKAYKELISLPFHAKLTNKDVEKVCYKLRKFLNE